LRQGCGEAIAPALVQALTDVLYALDRVDRGLGDQAAVEWELARARWALLGLLARTYVAIEELLTPAAKQLGQLGVTVLGRGSGRNIWLVEAV
jgi:hypothetical protein